MPDREKVIKALEHCKDNQHVNDCDECNYGGKTGMFCVRMIDDVLSLLKEQETIVRCKDCKYCHIHGNRYDVDCLAGHNITYIDGFCSEGKKRETSKEEQLK